MPPNAKIRPGDQALDRLMKSVPTEFAAAFIALNSFMETAPPEKRPPVLQFAALLMLVILPFYLWKVRGVTGSSQQIATWLAFLILAVNINGSALLGWTDFYSPYYGSALVILWAIIAPIFTVRHGREPVQQDPEP